MGYILDTNICIYIIKKKPKVVFDRLQGISPNQIFISTITLAELEYGIEKSSFPDKNRIALDEFLKLFTIADFDQLATRHYGEIRSDLEKKGISIGPLDTLIAAHSKSLNLILVTNNDFEFARVEGLQIENWTK